MTDWASNPVVQKLVERAHHKAIKAGVPIDGALFIAHGLADGHERTLVIFGDRVVVHDHGKMTSFTKKGRGVEELAISRITSVEMKKTKIVTYSLTFHASGTDVEFYDIREMCGAAREVVTGLMSRAVSDAAREPVAPDPLEQLRKLGELRDAGILTHAEFEAKKAELLRRT